MAPYITAFRSRFFIVLHFMGRAPVPAMRTRSPPT
jgi:hypothetical protein